MSVLFGNREISVFTINTRSSDPAVYWPSFRQLVAMSDAHDYDGMLCFSANETMIDPWMAAHYLMQNSRRMVPIVALSPVYMHPFSAAKMVSSMAYMHGRKTILNLITGASARDRETLHDEIDHDARYARLAEYAEIMQRLVKEDRMFDYTGDYYQLTQAVLSPQLPPEIHPGFLVAGHSPAALQTADRLGAIKLRMLDPQLEDGLPQAPSGLGIHLGIIARPTEQEAWEAAHARYPSDPDHEGILDFLMEESDSHWKIKMYQMTKAKGEAKPGYWLEPFGQLRADCPYLVGSYEQVSTRLAAHIERGVDWMVLDLPPEEEEFAHSAAVLRQAYDRLGIRADKIAAE